jgi:DNA adenine methylase
MHTCNLKIKKPVPFLKWAGGKKQSLFQFNEFFPEKDQYERYIEPFVGGGAVFFYLDPKKAIIADLNKDLINAYRMIKKDVNLVIKELDYFKKNHSKDFFLSIRKKFNNDDFDSFKKAAGLIYLNKTCFNGLYRVNKKGEFNVPFANHKDFNFNIENLTSINKILKNTIIKSGSFVNVLSYAKKGDFIYLDPPYHPLNKTSSFTTYTKKGFLKNDQEELVRVFKKLDKRGCKIMLSNSNTEFIKNLYKDYFISKVISKRYINSVAKKRGAIVELLIRNYN